MKIKTLKAELDKLHPTTGLTYDVDSEAASAQLNDENVVVIGIIPSTELLAWAASAGRFTKIKTAANDLSHPSNSASMAAVLLLERDGASLDLNLADRIALVDGLVATAVLSADDKTSLITLAQKNISRATELGLDKVKSGHITQARSHI